VQCLIKLTSHVVKVRLTILVTTDQDWA